MSHAHPPKSESILHTNWVVLALMIGMQASIAFVYLGIGPLAPFIEVGLGLNKSQIGLISSAFNVGSALTAILAGRVVDLRGEKNVLVVGTILTGVGTIIASRGNSFYLLLCSFFVTGLLATSATPAGSKAIMNRFPKTRLGFALSVRQSSVPLGGLLAALTIPPLALAFGWHTAVLIMGFVPIIFGLIFQMAYKVAKEDVTGFQSKPTAKSWTVLKDRNIWLVSFTAMTYLAAQSTVLTYLVLYLHEHAGVSTTRASFFLVVANCGGIIGRIFWGSLSDTVFHGERRPAFGWVGVLAVLMTTAMMFLSPKSPNWVVALVSLLLGFSAIGWNGVYVAFITKLAGKEQAGTALGFSLTIHYIGGLVFPSIFGLFADSYTSYRISWVSLSITLVIGVLLVGMVRENKL